MPAGVSAWSALGSLLHELRRRRVVQVALGYAALALVILQVGDTLVDALEWPVWVMRLLIGGLALGFPLAIGLAWFFDLTPAGITRDLGAALPDAEGPHLAAMLALQPVGDPAALRAPLRRLLQAAGAQRIETDGRGLLAEFRSAREALHCALRGLAEHGSTLRAALSIGEVSHDHGHLGGAALADVQDVARHAAPGGLALSGAVREANLARLHPEIGTRLRAVQADGDDTARAWVAGAEDLATLAFDARPRAEAGTRSPAAVVALSAAVLLALGVGALVWFVGAERAPRLPAASIAVLPFTTLSDQREDAWFAEGLADEMMSALAGVEGLQVAARASAYALKGQSLDVQAIGARLGVASVLEATVRRDGQRLRITAQLSDTRNGTTVWTAAYDEELLDLFDLQRRIATRATESLLGFIPNEGKPLIRRLQPTLSVGAYEDYLRGQEALKHPTTETTIGQAKGFFRSALAADAGFVRAEVGLCRAEIKRFISWRLAEAFTAAEAACARAEAMDPTLREVDLAMGELYQAKAEPDLAIARFTRALEDPGLRVDANLGLARVEADRGEAVLALEFFDRAAALSPGNWQVYSKRGYFHYQRQEYELALAAYRTALALDPMNAALWNYVGGLHQLLNQPREAIDAWTRSLAIEPIYDTYSNLGVLQFSEGRYTDAAATFRRAIEFNSSDYRPWAYLGDALAAAGDAAAATEPFRQALRRIDEYLAVRAVDAEPMAHKSWILANLGQSTLALEFAQRAESIESGNAEAALWVAQTYALLGDEVRARAAVQRALDAGIDSSRPQTLPVLKRLG